MSIENPSAPSADLPLGADVSLRDIARLAGVSVSTVSRVINQAGMVTPAKLKAVGEVLSRFSYIPNNAARALIKRRSLTIGLIVPTMANPLFVPAIEAIEEALGAAGYGLLVACSNRDRDREFEQTRTMLERGVDGMILTGPSHRHDLLPMIHSKGVATVFQDCASAYSMSVSIAMQDAAAMALAIDTLVHRGHRRIAVLTGPTGNTPPVAERVRSAIDRLAKHGIPIGPGDIEETPDYEAATARAAVRRLLDRQRGYTAIACTGDILALGAIMEIRHAGLAVPHDISIIGCSDSPMAQYVDPPLTTIHLPYRYMGEVAAKHLLSSLNGGAPNGPHYLDFHLVERASVRTL